jgi:hypothetical protein
VATSPRFRALQFEPLEVRRLLSITVDTPVDEYDGSILDRDISLRDAIAAATAGETILFDTSLDGGTILLDQALGELDIDKSIQIDATGLPHGLTIDADGGTDRVIGNGDGFRIFNIDDGNATPDETVEISGLTLSGGDSPVAGGAILNLEDLTVSLCTIENNSVGNDGGGIYNFQGELSVTASTINSNSATKNGGGIANIQGSITVIASTIEGNSAGGIGGGISSGEGNVTVTECTIMGNSATQNGGGIFHVDGNLVVTASAIQDNTTGGSGGGIVTSQGTATISDCMVSDNSAGDDVGGIVNEGGALTMINSTISRNSATNAVGGIANWSGDLVMTACTVNDNTALVLSGGVYNENGDLTLTACTISGNSSRFGGGIFNDVDTAGHQSTISNCTISANHGFDAGGGIFVSSGLTLIQFSTITANQAPDGAGSGVASYANATTNTEVYSSIIAGNVGTDVDFVYGGDNSFDSSGFNLIGTGNAADAFGATGDQVIGTRPPGLSPLAAHGGPTWTHALLPGSPAIDAGDRFAVPGVGSVPLYDQRGAPFARVDVLGGQRIDIGSFERHPPAALVGDYNQNGVVDAADYVVWRKTLDSSVTPYTSADGNGDCAVDGADRSVWMAHFGQTLPPVSVAIDGVVVSPFRPDMLLTAGISADVAFETLGRASVRGQETRAQLSAVESLRDFQYAFRRDATTSIGRLESPRPLRAVPHADLLLVCLPAVVSDEPVDEARTPTWAMNSVDDAAEPLVDARDRVFELVGDQNTGRTIVI